MLFRSHNLSDYTPKAIFFDMDGVLYDSMKFHAQSWCSAMSEMGINFSEYEAYLNEGRTGSSTINGAYNRDFGRNATDDEIRRIYGLKSTYFESHGPSPLMPFAGELLQKVRSLYMDIYLVTGSGQPSLLESLEKHFPSIFVKERMVTAFDVTHGKPHPEPYLQALSKSKLSNAEIAVVENAPLGVESAKAAGLFVIAVNTGPLNASVLQESGADIVLSGIEELYYNWENFLNASSPK